ncbi:MAG: CocE/NonD family hydrolase [Mucilaginibacter polytrichastri]|nr:CocE/NonD family hydrolase [Mucilaginibacter polytrichastri]
MKKFLFFFAVCFSSSIFLYAQTSDSAYIRQNYTKMEKQIAMRDGKKLFTSIYIPKDRSKKYPIMMNRTPYTVAPYGENEYKTALGPSTQFVHEGYIFVYQDVRGKWMSEGDFVNVRPHIANKKKKTDVDESSDTYDTIDWLIKNLPNNNGKVGVYGISYPGFYSTTSLPDAHPALKAVSPQAPVTDWFIGDDFHHKGVFFQMDAFAFMSSFGVPRPKPITPDKGPKGFEFYTKDNYKFYLETGALPNFNRKFLGDSIAFWNEMMQHPNYDAYWQSRNIRPHLTKIKPATLVVGGLFDAEDCFGAWETYKALEKQNDQSHPNMIVMGPWYHGQWARGTGESLGDIPFGQKTSEWYRENVEFPFFQYWLKDVGDPYKTEATVFLTGANEWKKFDTWPPKNTREKTLYFQPDGKLSFEKPSGNESFDEYVSDPANPVPYQDGVQFRRTREYMIDDQRFAGRRPDVKSYQTDSLAEDITLTGPLLADLFSSTTGSDADYVVKLIDVYPDSAPTADATTPDGGSREVIYSGYQMLVRAEIMRGRFRNSFEKPEAFTPNKVEQVKFELPDVAHTFKKGHKIMIQVQNTWFPLADRNPQKFVDIYTAKDEDFQKANIRIYHDAAHASGVKVTVMQ